MPKPPILTATCSHCGTSFTYERLGKRLRQYCSPRCARQVYAAREKANRTKPPATNCEFCGTSITVYRSPRRFCSDECRHKAYCRSDAGRARDQRRREKVVRPGGIGTTLRQRVFDRDGWRCRRCGCAVQMEQPAAIDSATLRLINPRSKGGERSLSNAETVCRRCCGQLGAIASKAKLNPGHVLDGTPSIPASEFLESSPPLYISEEPRLVSATANTAGIEPAATGSINATSQSN